jgi:hypothetical protein
LIEPNLCPSRFLTKFVMNTITIADRAQHTADQQGLPPGCQNSAIRPLHDIASFISKLTPCRPYPKK